MTGPAWAQGEDWPTKAVRIVCPFTPGGSQDNIARRLGVKLTDLLGQSFLIDNRTGDTPTLAEAGLPDLVVTSWSMWAVPAGTSPKIKDKLRAATDRALQSPDVIASMKAGGFEPGSMSMAEGDAFIKAEHKRWGEVSRAAGINPQ